MVSSGKSCSEVSAMRLVVLLFLTAALTLLVGCSPTDTSQQTDGNSDWIGFRDKCKSIGGSPREYIDGSFGCQKVATDGKDPCRDGSECEFGCFATSRLSPGSEGNIGSCAITDVVVGCNQRLMGGVAGKIVCVD